jgi:hypothetical protein
VRRIVDGGGAMVVARHVLAKVVVEVLHGHDACGAPPSPSSIAVLKGVAVTVTIWTGTGAPYVALWLLYI